MVPNETICSLTELSPVTSYQLRVLLLHFYIWLISQNLRWGEVGYYVCIMWNEQISCVNTTIDVREPSGLLRNCRLNVILIYGLWYCRTQSHTSLLQYCKQHIYHLPGIEAQWYKSEHVKLHTVWCLIIQYQAQIIGGSNLSLVQRCVLCFQ